MALWLEDEYAHTSPKAAALRNLSRRTNMRIRLQKEAALRNLSRRLPKPALGLCKPRLRASGNGWEGNPETNTPTTGTFLRCCAGPRRGGAEQCDELASFQG
jgi:hypothetical protein